MRKDKKPGDVKRKGQSPKKNTNDNDNPNNTQATESFKKSAENKKPLKSGRILPPDARRKSLKGKRFVFTCAQNNTEVHEGFLAALQTYCKDKDAQLVVSQFTYNKNAFENKKSAFQGLTKDSVDDLWYDPKILPYTIGANDVVKVTDDLIFCGGVDILPTAANPLSGFDTYCKGASGIIPHTQLEMKSLPGIGLGNARFMYTTGTCTKRNYIQRKAGQKAEFHHSYSALVVEVDDDGRWFVRQLVAEDSGAFQDLDTIYLPTKEIQRGQTIEAFTPGDIHVEFTNPEVEAASFGKAGIVDTLKPKFVFVHDLLHFLSRSHHNIRDFFHNLREHYKGGTVESEVELAAAWLKANERENTKLIVVDSNHHDHLQKWLTDPDSGKDPVNASYYLRLKLALTEYIKAREAIYHRPLTTFERFLIERTKGKYSEQTKTAPGIPESPFLNLAMKRAAEKPTVAPYSDEKFNLFEYAVRAKEKLTNVRFLKPDESYLICRDKGGGIDNSLHGHKGPNGAKGSPNGLRTVGPKITTGHTHVAGIKEGVYTAGVSGDMNQGYNEGAPSSWSYSHVITYPNGKRTLITVKNGKWRAENKVPALTPEFTATAGKPVRAKNKPAVQKKTALKKSALKKSA